ncbi:MAG: DnaJ domain-containing protein [Litorimonas sp.]
MTRQQALLTLGLSMNAREGDIRSAWRKKAKFFHPDAPYGNVTAFLQAKDAFETLIPPAPQKMRVRAGARMF